MRLLLCALLVACGGEAPPPTAPPAPAEPAPTPAAIRSDFRDRAHYNLHMADEAGAQGSRLDARVAVTGALTDGAPVALEDAGERGDYSFSPSFGRTETTARWRHAWTGVVQRTGEASRIELSRVETSCTIQREDAGRAEAPTVCRGAGPRLVLDCVPDDATVEGGAHALRCASEDEPPAETTAFPWLFVEGRCVERSGGLPMTGPMTHILCPEE